MRTTFYSFLVICLSLFGSWDVSAQTDCTPLPPLTPFCQDLNTTYMPGACMVEVWAKDFISKINDDNTNLDDFFISFHPTDTVMSQIFISEDGNNQTILIYIKDQCGSSTICEVELDINDNTGDCPGACPIDVKPWCGYAVVTCSAFGSDDYTAAIIDTRKNSQAPRGANWTDPLDTTFNKVDFIRPNTWQLGDIGQVFGTALSPEDGSIFFAASDVYALDFKLYAEAIDPAFLRGETPPTCPGPGGAAGIYKTSFDNQAVTTLVGTSTTYLNAVDAIGNNLSPNSGNDVQCASTSIEGRSPIGNGIGNIAYDARSNHLYASNLEDGKIYSINANTGIIDFIFDPFSAYETHASEGMVRTLDRVWGVQIRNCGAAKKLFFSRSSLEVAGTVDRDKEIYSVFIGGDGNFIGSEQLEFIVPFGRQAKITDIAFSADCNKVLVTERGHPHKAQVHEYVLNDGNWEHSQQFFVGIFSPNDPTQPDGNILGTSASGGVSYGPREENCVVDASCDDLVWSTINCGSPESRDASRCSIYGAQGMNASGNLLEDHDRTDIYISFSENITRPLDFKTNIGDIDIFNCCCPESPGRDTVAAAMITGIVTTAFESNLRDVEVSIDGRNAEVKVMSNESGQYAFDQAVMHSDYMIQANKEGEALDGLTTLDLIEIQRHILGLRKLNSPYKVIAADINNSGSVTAQDLIELRKVLIGVEDNFANNKVWNVLAKEATETENPFDIKSYIEVKDLPSSMLHANFVAIKTGDVNGDNSLELAGRTRTKKSQTLLANKRQEAGQTVVDFYLEENQSLSGMQFELKADANISSIVNGQIELSNEHMNISNGTIQLAWNSNKAIEITSDIPLFSMSYEDTHATIELGDKLVAEVYNDALETTELLLENESSTEFEGISVSPNPTTGLASVKFYSSSAQAVDLQINSISGQRLMNRTIRAHKGINEVSIDAESFESNYTGISLVQIITPEKIMNTKLLLIK